MGRYGRQCERGACTSSESIVGDVARTRGQCAATRLGVNGSRRETWGQRRVRGPETLVVHSGSMSPVPEQLVRRRVALIAHDNKKTDIVECARFNLHMLARHELCATGTTGQLLTRELGLRIECLLSGPLGGDLQIGARIAEGKVDLLVFFWDPLEPQPHDPDVKALLRLAVAWNIPVACNRASADFLISSPLFSRKYERLQPDFADYASRGWAAVAASADQVA
jgi:methylglyoxal synthase